MAETRCILSRNTEEPFCCHFYLWNQLCEMWTNLIVLTQTRCPNAVFEYDLFSVSLTVALTLSAVREHCCIFFFCFLAVSSCMWLKFISSWKATTFRKFGLIKRCIIISTGNKAISPMIISLQPMWIKYIFDLYI